LPGARLGEDELLQQLRDHGVALGDRSLLNEAAGHRFLGPWVLLPRLIEGGPKLLQPLPCLGVYLVGSAHRASLPIA
jgi:hypothetical protein